MIRIKIHHTRRVAALCFMIVVAASAPALGDALFTYGYTPRGMAMGNAIIAGVDDFSASYYNPAGMALLEKPSFGIGYMATGDFLKALHADDEIELDDMQGLLIGSSIPLPFGAFLSRRLAFGFSCFFPDGVILAIKVPYPTEPQYVLLQNSGRSLSVAATVSLRIIDGVAVGGGAQLFDNTSGRIDATVDPNGKVEATVGQELTSYYAPIAGVMIRPELWSGKSSGFRFAAVFREKFFTEYEIPISSYLGGVPLVVNLRAVSLFTPRQWIGGVGYGKNGSYHYELDVSYNEWSEFPDPNFDIDVKFEIPLLPIEFQNSKPYQTDFKDTVTIRAGGEKKFYDGDRLDLWGRGGYAFEPSPVPDQTGETNYLDGDRHIGAIGLGMEIPGFGFSDESLPHRFDFVFQYHYLQKRVFKKDTSIDADNPGYPRIGIDGSLWAVGASYSTLFDYQ